MLGRLLGLVALSALAAAAMAGPQTYAQRVQNIRAGVVILDSAKTSTPNAQPLSAGPYALYNLDSNTTVKPVGWNFYNPFAASRVTPAIASRWLQIDPAHTPGVGTPINKRNAAYWEVFLGNVTDSVLANYDLLVVNPAFFAQLNPTEQNRLRRFVDNGGVLWIDPAGLNGGGGGIDPLNNFPLPFSLANGGGIQQTDFSNSLMNSIQTLTPFDINVLDAASPSNYILQNVPALAMTNIAGGTSWDFPRLQPVSLEGGQPSMMLGRIGEGLIVVTANGASIKLNRSQESTSYAGNGGFNALDPYLEQDGIAAAKLAVNIVGLLHESRQQGASSRKTSSSAIDLNPPLLQRSTIPDSSYALTTTTTGTSNTTPALYKGLLVVTTNGYLKVYDANPITDLDGDGNPDDGLQDYSLGAPYDEIWESAQMPTPVSAPVCAEVPGSSPGSPQDEVLVVDGAGTLHIFNLMPRDSNSGLLTGVAQEATPIKPPNGSPNSETTLTGVPIAPTVHEGVAYITDMVQLNSQNTGRIWQVDLQHGAYVSDSAAGYSTSAAAAFVLGGNNSSVSFPEFSYSATVGYIPILDNSGGVDKVLYAPFAANTNAGVNAAGFLSVWIGAKGEVPSAYEPTAGNSSSSLIVTTRASTHGGLPIYTGSGSRGVKLTLLDANGNPLTDAQMALYLKGTAQDLGNGVLSFAPASGNTFTMPAGITGVRVDYTINWGSVTPGVLASAERGRVILPDVAQLPSRVISGGVALSPQGTAYVVNSNGPTGKQTVLGPPGGGLYGFREQGVGIFNCILRYELYGQHTAVLNQATDVTVPPVLADYDTNFQQIDQTLFGNPSLSNFEFRGGPSIRNGQVFVTASAKKLTNGGPISYIPVTIVMAFNAEPQTAGFSVGTLTDGTEILQPDFARSTLPTQPENQTVIAAGSYSYDTDTGIISFPTLMNVQRGQIQNCLSLSQPIIIRQPGSSDKLVYPDTIGGAVWSPLQWFHVIDGAYPSGGAPTVTGNSVFVGLDSFALNAINGIFTGATTGLMYAVNAQIPTAQLHPLANQPWLNQLWTIDSLSPFTADPNVVWPQLSSVSSFSDFKIKMNQTALTGSTVAYGAVGGDGALAAWSDAGVTTFAKSNFLICDEGRIVEMDPSGNPVWSTDVSASAGQSAINSAGVTKPLIRPVRAYKITDTSILFADAGANRVATINTSGVESRSITNFRLDPAYTPAGYAPGESLTLAGPRDALYYSTVVNMVGGGVSVSNGDNEISNYEYWQHYLIADTGNKRLVEVIDRFYYNPTTQFIGQPVTVNGIPQIGVLLWHSPAAASGRGYDYTSVTRVLMPGTGPSGGHYVYVCGTGATMPSRVGAGLDAPSPQAVAVDAKNGSGGIVIYDPLNPSGAAVFNEISTPNVLGTAFWDSSTNQFDTLINTSTTLGQQLQVRRQGGPHRLSNLNSVTAKVLSRSSAAPYDPNNCYIAIMVADGSGVYEVAYDPTLGSTQTLTVQWMMPNEVFRNILQNTVNNVATPTPNNAIDLRAMFARRLDSGEVLIVNGYYGATQGNNPFSGEVMQVDGTINTANFALQNLGFGSQQVTLDLRSAGSTAFRGLLMPVFADRR